MKNIVLLLSIMLFVGCNNSDMGIDNLNTDYEYEFADTEFSVMEVLTSAEGWHIPMNGRCYYTEPDGQGEMHKVPQGDWVGGGGKIYSFSEGMMTTYVNSDPPKPDYFRQRTFTKEGDDRYVFGDNGEFYWKILDYDEDKFYIECNVIHGYVGGVYYPYTRCFLIKNDFSAKPNWKDRYVSYEEYLKALEELENK